MKEQKNNQPVSRRKYDQDFKTEALRMIANGRSVYQVAQALGVGENLLYRWRSQQQSADGLTKGKEKIDSPLAVENERLRHQVRQLEEERQILKKALAIFSRQT
ncbi:transposase [Spirosoma sp. SC4-14]|uniref:transposase n=1 Tax=Spirosoma sp. SC4-14 TaxID=3128900 RepID=UPI0030CA97B3